MKLEIKKLIDNGIIICGRIIKEDGIVRFERVESSDIDKIPEDEIGFATVSMGRAIFTIDNSGKIHNFKGVDSHLQSSEIGLVKLVNAKSIEYLPNENSYKISAVVFNNKKPEIRINGASPLEDIEIEGDINEKLMKFGIKVPEIKYIKEIPQNYSLKYGLPIKAEGSLDKFECDYKVEDDERKKRLSEIYGDNYTQELKDNQRPESMKEYLQRVGFLSSPEIKEKIEQLGYSIEDFVKSVDTVYSRGQRYGQAERIMESPFRISDLETYIVNGDKERLKAIIDFSENGNKDFARNLAEIYGKNIALLINNGWECGNLIHRQDYSLAGEFCDDSFFDKFKEIEKFQKKHKLTNTKDLWNSSKSRYVGQVMHIASCIKVIQDSMLLTGEDKEYVNTILEKFSQSFTDNLDFEKIALLFKTDKTTIEKMFMDEFKNVKSWTNKMAIQYQKDGIIIDEAIFNSHIENDNFYNKTAKMIYEKLRINQKINNTENDKIGFFSRISNKIKNIFKIKTIKKLPNVKEELKSNTDIDKNKKSVFVDNLKENINIDNHITNENKVNNTKQTINDNTKNIDDDL